MVLIGYEVRDNIDMNGYGYIGGEKLICEKGCILQRKATIKSKYFKVIRLTNFLGGPIGFIVIIEGEEQLFDVWDGNYLSKEKFEDDSE